MGSIPSGRHLAKPISYGLTETKAGDPQVWVKFKLEGDGSEITWAGSLKEGKAREITIDALLVLGFRGNDLGAMEDAADAIIDMSKTVSITVEDETYEGKTRTKVKWVNSIDGGTYKKMDPSKKSSLKAITADIMARRKEKGVPDPIDEIPF